jgi:hypothetical protein
MRVGRCGVYALAIFYIQQGRRGQTATCAERLVGLHPNVAGPRRLLRQIRRLLQKRFGPSQSDREGEPRKQGRSRPVP